MFAVSWIIAFIGHTGLWCASFNYLHSTALKRWARKSSEAVVLIFLVLPVLFLAWQLFGLVIGWTACCSDITFAGSQQWSQAYTKLVMLLAIPVAAVWLFRKITGRPPTAVVSLQREVTKLVETREKPLLHNTVGKLMRLIPVNEALSLCEDHVTLRLDIPPALDGLKIAQLSDFHLTGDLDIQFFQKAVDKANAFEPDIIVVSGDLIDKRECFDWIEPLFGRLQAKHGVFYVLGNHDLRVRDEEGLRARLHDVGWQRLGGSWKTLELNGCSIEIAGNELPWFTGAEYLPLSADAEPGQQGSQADLKILVSHSPDQLVWAEPYQFDLMFAGHNHGGQVAFPLVGPIIAPSKFGVKYASGTFQIGSMLMHVSRGLSADRPIRWNSRPEVGLFTLQSANEDSSS
jgi:predicted MPP superfamily phosphohydrolase